MDAATWMHVQQQLVDAIMAQQTAPQYIPPAE